MGVSEKDPVDQADYPTITLMWLILVPCTILMYRITTFAMDRREKLHRAAQRKEMKNAAANSAGNSSVDRKVSASSKSEREHDAMEYDTGGHAMSWLISFDPLKLVSTTALFQWIRLLLDCISWTYSVTQKQWDLFVVVIDGISLTFGTVSAALLVLVFVQRCFITFVNSSSQHSALVYGVILVFAALVALFGVVSGILSLGRKWELLGFFSDWLCGVFGYRGLIGHIFFRAAAEKASGGYWRRGTAACCCAISHCLHVFHVLHHIILYCGGHCL